MLCRRRDRGIAQSEEEGKAQPGVGIHVEAEKLERCQKLSASYTRLHVSHAIPAIMPA